MITELIKTSLANIKGSPKTTGYGIFITLLGLLFIYNKGEQVATYNEYEINLLAVGICFILIGGFLILKSDK